MSNQASARLRRRGKLDGDEGLGADAEVAAVLAFEFVKGAVVEDFWGVGGGVRGFAFDVVADDVWHAGDSEAGGCPAVPAEEEVLGAFALVAGEVGVGEGALAEEGAAEAAPVGGDDGSSADAGVGEVHPPAPAPAVFGSDFPDVAIRRAFFDAFAEAAHAFVLALGGCLVFAGFQPGLAGFVDELEAEGEFALVGQKIFGDLVALGAEAAEEEAVWVGGGGDVVVGLAVGGGHVEGPFEDAQRVSGNDGVALDDEAAGGADFSGEGEGRALEGGDAELRFFFVSGAGVVFDGEVEDGYFPAFGQFALGDLGGGFGFLTLVRC